MAYTTIPSGLSWPIARKAFIDGTAGVIDATGEKYAFIGSLHIAGRPTTSKTIDTTGSSSIGFNISGRTYVNAASTLDIGLQGITTGGPPARPDGTFTVKKTMVGGTDTFANGWNEKAPSTGTATLNHGDRIAVVFDFTNRAGADTISIAPQLVVSGSATGTGWPTTNAFAAAAWNGPGSALIPNVTLTFSDGTVGWIEGMEYVGAQTSTIWTDATNPDEVGMIFQVPFGCKVDALWTAMRTVDATSDFQMDLYSTPETGATSMLSGAIAVDADQFGATGLTATIATYELATEVTLAANTDYCVGVKATGAGNIRIDGSILGAAGHRVVWPGTTTMRSVTRNNGAGNFASSSTTLIYPIGIKISAIDTGSAGGGAILSRVMTGM